MDWEPDEPNSLLDICVRFCVENAEVLCEYDKESDKYELREGTSLPSEICELLASGLCESRGTEKLLYMFKDCDRTKLKRLRLRHTVLNITEDIICTLLRHNLSELDIIGCDNLRSIEIIKEINAHSRNLSSLCVSDYFLFQEFPLQQIDLDSDASTGLVDADYIFNCPRLKSFGIHELHETQCSARDIIRIAIKPMVNLSQLDLSYCQIEFETMDCITHLHKLMSLILYEVPIKNINMAFSIIVKLKHLRALDLSQGQEQPIEYQDATNSLSFLVENLPELRYLDLSGTNLAGFIKEAPVEHRLGQRQTTGAGEPKIQQFPIPGLENRHLEFLGLLGSSHDPSTRENIPANKITGDANEEQIILSTQMYVEKKELLTNALNTLFKIFRFSVCHDQRGALEGILNGMKKWPLDRSVQICGSASLFYIVKGEKQHHLNTNLKRRIIRVIITAMDRHMDEATMMRNGCLTLCNFKIPQDVLFVYRELVAILLKMVRPPGQEEFVQRVGIYLLNSLACQVDGKEKQMVGDLGAISTMLEIIRHKLETNVCDEVMEIAWSTMWNVTDETSVNCQRFIDEGGMDLFLSCLKTFMKKDELLRNMMGLLGNVAEVPFLRCKLMESDYVTVFSELLDSNSDGIEVSYNACGVLAHMVSDGQAAWSIEEPSRQSVLQKIMKAISRWKLRTKRNINYRSFEPILRLLPMFDTPECQYWAVWALCNLTKMYRSKYCPLVEKEKGLPLLQNIAIDTRPYPQIRRLAQEVLDRYERYIEEPDVMTEDEMDNTDEDMPEA